jgi:hypothetical protein
MRSAVNTLTPDKHTVEQPAIEPTRQPVLIQNRNEQTRDKQSCPGVLLGKHFTPAQRVKRATLSCAIMWLLATASAFIPLAHFLLVPVFAIAGPVLGYLRYRQEDIAEAAEGKCPSCLQEFRILLDQRTMLPHRDVCPHCDKHIQIVAYSNTGGES